MLYIYIHMFSILNAAYSSSSMKQCNNNYNIFARLLKTCREQCGLQIAYERTILNADDTSTNKTGGGT